MSTYLIPKSHNYPLQLNRANDIGLTILLMSILNLIWVTLSTIINELRGYEALISSLRISLSTLLIVLIYRKINIRTAVNFVYTFAIVNSILVVLQLVDAIIIDNLLPPVLKSGALFGVIDSASVDPWRNSGIVPSLLTSSLLAIFGLIIGIRKSRKGFIYLFLFPFFIVTLFFGSRTIILLMPFVAIYLMRLAKIRNLFFIAILFILIIFGSLNLFDSAAFEGFDNFVSLRYGGLFNVIINLDLGKDYSAADTFTSYITPSNAKEFFFGNSCDRYSNCGGGDPFFSRWLIQAGFPSIVLLTSMLTLLSVISLRYSKIIGLVGLAAIFIGLKGEVATSLMFYDAYFLSVLLVLYHKNLPFDKREIEYDGL
jgi:hypothetical protein